MNLLWRKKHIYSGFIEKIFWYPKLIICFLERIHQIRDNIFWRRIPIRDPIARMTMHLPDKHERPEQSRGKMINAVCCLYWLYNVHSCDFQLQDFLNCPGVYLFFFTEIGAPESNVKTHQPWSKKKFPLNPRSGCSERVAPLDLGP